MKKETILIGILIIFCDLIALILAALVAAIMYEIQPIITIIVELCIIIVGIIVIYDEIKHIKYVISSLEN